VSETGFTFVFEPDSASVSGLDSDITQTTHKHVKGMCLSMPQRPGRSAAAFLMSLTIFFWLWSEEEMFFFNKA